MGLLFSSECNATGLRIAEAQDLGKTLGWAKVIQSHSTLCWSECETQHTGGVDEAKETADEKGTFKDFRQLEDVFNHSIHSFIYLCIHPRMVSMQSNRRVHGQICDSIKPNREVHGRDSHTGRLHLMQTCFSNQACQKSCKRHTYTQDTAAAVDEHKTHPHTNTSRRVLMALTRKTDAHICSGQNSARTHAHAQTHTGVTDKSDTHHI